MFGQPTRIAPVLWPTLFESKSLKNEALANLAILATHQNRQRWHGMGRVAITLLLLKSLKKVGQVGQVGRKKEQMACFPVFGTMANLTKNAHSGWPRLAATRTS